MNSIPIVFPVPMDCIIPVFSNIEWLYAPYPPSISTIKVVSEYTPVTVPLYDTSDVKVPDEFTYKISFVFPVVTPEEAL